MSVDIQNAGFFGCGLVNHLARPNAKGFPMDVDGLFINSKTVSNLRWFESLGLPDKPAVSSMVDNVKLGKILT